MKKQDSTTEMNLRDEVVEMLTPVGEPNFRLLSPSPVSDSKHTNIQSVSVLPLSTVVHSDVDRQKEEGSKKHLRRRQLEEIKKGKSVALDPEDQGRSVRQLEKIKKGKSIALDPEDQGRSVNHKRRKFNEVAPQNSKLKNWKLYFEVGKHKKPKLRAPNLDVVKTFEEKLTKSQLQIFSDTCFGFFLSLPPVMLQTQLIHSLLMLEVVQEKIDEIWLLVNGALIHFGLGEFAIMTGLKCNGVGIRIVIHRKETTWSIVVLLALKRLQFKQ